MAKFKPKIPSGTQEPPTVRLPIPLYRPLPPPTRANLQRHNTVPIAHCHGRATHPRTCWYPLAAIAQAPALIVLQRWRMATKPTPTNARPCRRSSRDRILTRRRRQGDTAQPIQHLPLRPIPMPKWRPDIFSFTKTWFKVHASRTTAHHEGYGSAPTTRRSLR